MAVSQVSQKLRMLSLDELLSIEQAEFARFQAYSETLFRRRHGTPRIGVCGPTDALPPGHRSLQVAAAIGRIAYHLRTDLVTDYPTKGSVAEAARNAFLDLKQKHGGQHRWLVAAVLTEGARAGLPVRVGDLPSPSDTFFSPSIVTASETFGFLCSAVVIIDGGIGGNAAEANRLAFEMSQRGQFLLKIGKEKIGFGLRPQNLATVQGFVPEVLLYGDHWEHMKEAQETYVRCRTVNAQRKEQELLQFMPHGEESRLQAYLSERVRLYHSALRTHRRETRTSPLQSGVISAGMETCEIIRRIHASYLAYEELKSKIAEALHQIGYLVSVWGSHHLDDFDDELEKAEAFGYWLGYNAVNCLEGNGGPDGIMGRIARGHARGVETAVSDGRFEWTDAPICIGNSLSLGWELAGEVVRPLTLKYDALRSRIDVFANSHDSIERIGGFGTGLERMENMSRSLNLMRKLRGEHHHDFLPLCHASKRGWVPHIRAVGSRETMGFNDTFCESMRSTGELSVEHGEDELFKRVDSDEQLKPWLLERKAQFDELYR